ncbi:MAG: UDP-N-acetylmuramoyl-tripeptide--D-alanyl-D-alanine ligase, partial [Leptospiraceae bacterium]|nr:UDP-N-acetylmuramoyl-tripeptide--D-alanyl-D-alanine ligase [Leptospiraceae bacterium]
MKERFEYSSFTVRSILENKFQFKESQIFKYISTSSEECEADTLFVPLKGNRDGHEFIPKALENGASHFLCEHNHPVLRTLSDKKKEKAIFVSNTLEALGKLASFHRNRFSPFVIGITGSSGKTTTKEFFYSALKYLGEEHLVVTEKNYNNEIGLPFTLFKIGLNTKVVVCEMGMNHLFEISRLTKLAKPSIAVITNIGQAHIENLGSVENIAHAKSEIMEGLCANSFLFVPENVRKKDILERKAMLHNVNIQTYSLNSAYLKILEEYTDGFLLEVFGKKVRWNLPGRQLLWNLAGVLYALSFSGFEHEKLIEGILTFQPADKRNVWIHKKNLHILDDTYNA